MPGIQIAKLQTLSGHNDAIYTLQQSNDPAVFFSASGDGMVVKWDLRSPEEGELIAKLPNSIYALHHLKKQDLLVAGHNYEGIHVLDWKSKVETGSLKLSSAAIFDIQSFGSDVFVASGDGTLTVVDVESLTVKNQVKCAERNARTIAINPLMGEVAVGYSDHFIRVFDLDDLSLKYEWKAHDNSVFTLVYSPDNRLLFSGSRDARLKAWQADQNYGLHTEIAAHLYAINHLAFSPDGKHFVTCSLDKSVKVWDADNLTLLKVIDKARHAGHGTSVNKLLWTSFNNQVISASDDRTISTWDVIF
jgi:WD40 repeat protein